MSKRLHVKELGSELFGHLEHFVEQGAWPVRVTEAQAKDVKKHLPFLEVTKLKGPNDKYIDFAKKQKIYRNYEVKLGKKPIPTDILAEYWHFRYKETYRRYEELYGKIKDLSENY